MNLSSAVRTAKSVIVANSPVLLVGTAIAGVISTGVLAAKGGYKARGIIDAEVAKRTADAAAGGEAMVPAELTVQDKARLTWQCYALPVVTCASTVASVVGVHTIHTKRHAALAALYTVTSAKLDEVKEQAEELMGPKKTQEFNDALGQKAADRNPVGDHEVIVLDGGNELCHDEFSGRWFLGSHAIVEQAVARVNIMLAESGDCSLNDFYDFVGLRPLPWGDNMGWSGQKINLSFGTVMTNDNRSAISYSFRPEPKDKLGHT